MTLSLANLVRVKEIRNKILITFGLLLCYRIGFFIPLPGVNAEEQLKALDNQSGMAAIFGMMSTLTGGSLMNATLFSLGVMPYISASIIFSLLTKVLPSLERLSKEGASGQKKINQYTRLATVGICLIQSMIVILGPLKPMLHTEAADMFGVYMIVAMVGLTAGTMFIMWLGEQITERGVGNGISLIIMAGIVADLPRAFGFLVAGEMGTQQWQNLLLFVGAWATCVLAVVFITKAQRRIPIQQAKHTRGRRVYGGQRHFLPFKLNQAGVMPIIFGSALLMIPALFGKAIHWTWLSESFSNYDGFWFVSCYTALIFFFSFFWTSMMFQPNDIANNLRENGSFIPGIRPGKQTAKFLEDTMVRMTLAGAAFLSVLAVMPSFVRNTDYMTGTLLQFMSGTSILIVVGVALDLVEKLNALLIMRNYEGFMKDHGEPAGAGWGRRGS